MATGTTITFSAHNRVRSTGWLKKSGSVPC